MTPLLPFAYGFVAGIAVALLLALLETAT